jgi:hypothetical protein
MYFCSELKSFKMNNRSFEKSTQTSRNQFFFPNLRLADICSVLDRKRKLHGRIVIVERVDRLFGEASRQVNNQVLDRQWPGYFCDLVVILIFFLNKNQYLII